MRSVLSQFSVSPLALRGVIVSLLLAFGLSSATLAQVATSTKLSASPSSVAVGVPTLLTATVADASSHTVLLGTVTFYEGNRSLGAAQIVSRSGGSFAQGTASLKTASFTPGHHSVTAIFSGTQTDAPSTSSAVTVMVTGKSKTATVLTAAVGSEASLILTATLQASGWLAPTGSIDFQNAIADVGLGRVPFGQPALNFVTASSPVVPYYSPVTISADFNGDGIPDLANINYLESLNVQFGNGDGTFKSPVVVYPETEDFLSDFAAGDFNNDGVLDLAVVDGSIITILLGNGDGTFQSPNTYTDVGCPSDLQIADFNRDGKLDLVSVDGCDGTIGVSLGNGDGTFQPRTAYASGAPNPSFVLAGDLNGDGYPDLVVTSGSSYFLWNNGNGTFQAPVQYAEGAAIIALGDMTGDGHLDLILSVGVALGNGNGTFQPSIAFPAFPNAFGPPTSPGSIVVADFNGDGKPDLAAQTTVEVEEGDGDEPYYQSYYPTVVLLGNGEGGFTLSDSYNMINIFNENPGRMTVADFNGDGLPDLILPFYDGDGNVYATNVFLNQQVASAEISNVYLPGTGLVNVLAKYSGDTNFASSTSPELELQANANTPQITGISATYGAPYATIQLTGNNFGATQGSSTVIFPGHAAFGIGQTPATVYAWSDTTISLAVPGSAVTGLVAVNVGALQSNAIPFTVVAPPTVSGISPSSGPVGTVVTITGTNLMDYQYRGQVWFSGQSLPILGLSNTNITVQIPSGAVSGVFNVHVNGVGVYTPVFTVPGSPAPPHLSGLGTNYGAPYAVFTLTGDNFGASQGSSTVTFNGVAAPIGSWTNSSITVSVPYRATTGNVVVTVAGQASNGIAFTVEPPLSVTGISPSSGPIGTTVTISGQNLVDAEGRGTVYFGGISLPILNPTNTSIQVVIPAGATSGVFNVHTNGVGVYTPTFTVN